MAIPSCLPSCNRTHPSLTSFGHRNMCIHGKRLSAFSHCGVRLYLVIQDQRPSIIVTNSLGKYVPHTDPDRRISDRSLLGGLYQWLVLRTQENSWGSKLNLSWLVRLSMDRELILWLLWQPFYSMVSAQCSMASSPAETSNFAGVLGK